MTQESIEQKQDEEKSADEINDDLAQLAEAYELIS